MSENAADLVHAGVSRDEFQGAALNLFGTDNPVDVLTRAGKVADALTKVIKDRNLYTVISGKAHVQIEGWQTLGAMLGVTSVCEWTRPVEKGWEARATVQTLDGRTIGAAESQCLRDETTWAKRDDYTLRSMAQTRASSKALASVLRFVVILRGYEGTPAEEMSGDKVPQSEPVSAEAQAEEAKVRKAYEDTAPPGSAARKKLGKAKLNAQIKGCEGDPDKLAKLRETVEGLNG